MTFDENVADREPPQLGGFFIGQKIGCFSVQPLCPLCLCGFTALRQNNHRGTEDTEVAQRRSGW
jgi:hypothetical protein